MTDLSREQIDFIKSIARSEALGLIIDGLITKYIQSWRTSSPEQPDRREHLYRMVQACEGLRGEILAISDDDLVTAHNNRSRINRDKQG